MSASVCSSHCNYNVWSSVTPRQGLTKNPSLKTSKSYKAFTKTLCFKEIRKKGSLKEAFESFRDSLVDSFGSLEVNRDEFYAPIIELCAIDRALIQGRQIHAHTIKFGAGWDDVFICTKLVFMYGKCGSILDAEKVFKKMRDRTVFTWNAMLGGYVSNGEPLSAIEMYSQMRILGVPFDSFTFSSVIKACGALKYAKCGAEVHGLVSKHGYDSIVFVVNSLIAMYAKWNDVDMAKKLFDRMRDKSDLVSWNSIIAAHSANGQCIEALGLFREMQMAGIRASAFTFVSALQACKGYFFRKPGKEIHAAVLKSSQYLDVYVTNALLAMYFRFGHTEEAAGIFDKFEGKDVVSWNSMLAGFIQNGLCNEALQFFYKFQDAGLSPDRVSITSIIAASGRLGYLLNGKEIHAYSIKKGFDTDVQVVNSLIDMYAKCCCMNYAGFAFHNMPNKDFISWTTVIAGYAQNNYHIEALRFFRQAQMEGMNADAMMIGSALLACSSLKSLSQVKEVHGYTIKQGLSDLMLLNTIVDAYGDCGSINYATSTFESIKHKDVVSWTSMISSYVQNGLANKAFEFSNLMKEAGFEPDSVTLVNILSAASSLSALKKGREIHGFIIRKGFTVEGSIENSLVDMYARCGSLENAHKLFACTKRENTVLYTTMINAYGMHGRGKAAVELFTEMMDNRLIPDHVTFLAVLYACSHSGLVEEGKRIIEIMKYEYHLEPWAEHYACMVDLLGRANCLEEAYQFVEGMPTNPTAEVWCALLRACQVHSNKELGEKAAQKLLELNPDSPGNYVLVSNVFASCGKWRDVEAVRIRMKRDGLMKNPGCSWIEVGNTIHSFIARDKSHPESREIYQKLALITGKLERVAGYVAQTNLVLHNVGEQEKVEMLYGHSERLAIAYGILRTPEGTTIRIAKNLRVCGDCHNFCKLVSKFFYRELIVRDASRFHHFESGVCSCGDFW